MAASVKIAGSTYTYTISNIQNALTLTPSNRNSRYGAVYSKPTITRNKSGSANSRYFFIWFGSPGEALVVNNFYVAYQATFTKTGTTATVTEILATSVDALGKLASKMKVSSGSGILSVKASETSSISHQWDSTETTATYTMSGWNPPTPTFNYDLSQNGVGDPDPTVFGYIAGYAKASWSASVTSATWQYSLNSKSGTIAPNHTLTVSANGASATSGAGTGTRAASLSDKLLSATSITGTAKVTNTIGGSSTSTKTITTQAYSQPIAKSLAVGRVTVNNEKHASMSIGWSVNELNKQSTASQSSIRSGAITCTWECEDLSNEGVLFSSGEFDIVSDGDAMPVLTDTTTATLVDTSENEHDVYDPDKSFRFTAYITDRINRTSLTISAILASEFYLICAREGGRGIGFGMVPPDDAMHVNMPATFYDNVEMNGDGVAIGTTAEQGYFKVSNELRPQLSGVMSQGLGTCWSAATEDAPYGRNNVAFGIGSDGNNKGIWCSEYNGNAGHWLIREDENGVAYIPSTEIRLKGHSSNIGTTKNAYLSTATSVSSGGSNAKSLCQLSLEAGTWIIIYGARFPTNTTGNRCVNMSTTKNDQSAMQVVAPASGGVTQTRAALVVTPSSTATYYLSVSHTATSALTMPASGTGYGTFMTAVRLM